MSNQQAGSAFVNKLTELYLSTLNPDERLDAIETLVDTAEDKKYAKEVKHKIAIALDFYAAKNNLKDGDYDEIDYFYEKSLDRDPLDAMNIFPRSPKDAVSLFISFGDEKKFAVLKEYFIHLSPDIFNNTISYYLGEFLLLYEEGTISEEQYYELWTDFNTSKNKMLLKAYFQNIHNITVDDFMADTYHKMLSDNVALRDDIATDWLIYMQDHSDMDEETLTKRVFMLMSDSET